MKGRSNLALPHIFMTLVCLVPWCACVVPGNLNSASPAAVKFTLQPGATPVGAAIAPTVVVQALDSRGRGVAGVEVTMSIGSNAAANGGSAVLGGTLTRLTDSTGIASFPDLTLDWLGTGYTLVAAASAPSGMISATSVPFDETRVGDACLGPAPACSSGCADTDGDGLNDAWESAGGVDLNGDGKIDAQHDLLLPGADPNKPDVYLKYDYMVATTTSATGTPPHSHQPPDAAIQQVVEAFASHGVNLHIDPQHDAIPEVPVTTLDPNPTVACAGPDFVTIQTLRQQHFGNRKWAFHYGVFAHNATMPDTGNPASCPSDPAFGDPECQGFPDPLGSGVSELPGDS